MKVKLIMGNWLMSFVAIGIIDTEHTSLWIVLALAAYFAISSSLMIWADKRGLLDRFKKLS